MSKDATSLISKELTICVSCISTRKLRRFVMSQFHGKKRSSDGTELTSVFQTNGQVCQKRTSTLGMFQSIDGDF